MATSSLLRRRAPGRVVAHQNRALATTNAHISVLGTTSAARKRNSMARTRGQNCVAPALQARTLWINSHAHNRLGTHAHTHTAPNVATGNEAVRHRTWRNAGCLYGTLFLSCASSGASLRGTLRQHPACAHQRHGASSGARKSVSAAAVTRHHQKDEEGRNQHQHGRKGGGMASGMNA